MSKRLAESDHGGRPLKGGGRPEPMDVDNKEMGEFEDEFEDEFESEDEIFEAGVDGRPDAEREAEERAAAAAAAASGAMDVDNGTFIVGRNKLEDGQHLTPDLGTYEMFHSLSTPWPCLSFDIVRDRLGDGREKAYPAVMYTVAGTQAESGRAKENQLMVMKFSGLSRTQRGDGDDSESDDDEDADEDADPILESKSIPLASTTNRIRCHQIPSDDPSRPPTTLTATMTESAHVFIHDVTPHLASFDSPGAVVAPPQNKSLSTVRAHKSEGYALDWSPLAAGGKLLTGDNDGLIYVTTRTDGGGWVTDTRAFQGHTGSVEEIQWSPQEASVFASASSDGTVRVWDVRSKSRRPALTVRASATDVNVMSWSRLTTHLLATGAEDGVWAVWDLRQWKAAGAQASSSSSSPVASFAYHRDQITSVEWHPTDDSMVAVAAADHKVTLWDLSVEIDDEESKDTAGVKDMPPQLLFEHISEHAKEVHWHPQIPGTLVATGQEFSIFRPIPVVYGIHGK
ncbi:WD40 repeat-like protein [Durotheca rogersii]|uniref:WD40 repeat-like protein n=1 Tax=Durotheca rogersii TaxID=419775 RepID=UPI002220D219|nr:WD40 repeat-like protein [Durotheca rogersii]KAI5860488.1 WD40 repeat-like protein [Durotheca rogersii]